MNDAAPFRWGKLKVEFGPLTMEIPEPVHDEPIEDVLARMRNAPVHWLVNPDNDPYIQGTACGSVKWTTIWPELFDPRREGAERVTCPECLAVLTDQPIIKDAKNADA